jgi:hypothetical protein
MKIGDRVRFLLDSKWEGTGIIEYYFIDHIGVKLDKDCKEFSAGTNIIVFYDEHIEVIE